MRRGGLHENPLSFSVLQFALTITWGGYPLDARHPSYSPILSAFAANMMA